VTGAKQYFLTDMKNEEILTKAIEKAINRGWKPMGNLFAYVPNNKIWLTAFTLGLVKARTIKGILFDHDFAKAFWGDRFMSTAEEDKEIGQGQTYIGKRYEYHLQQMVIEEDPIKYLEKFL
jgi:hypothetical protein